MSVAKVIELIATSSTSFDDAIQQGLKRANETMHNISGAWIKDQSLELSNGKVTQYKVLMHVTFVLNAPLAQDRKPGAKTSGKAGTKKASRRK